MYIHSRSRVAHTLFIIIFVSCLQGCKSSKICPTPSPVADTYFIIKEDGQTLSDTTVLSKLNICYINQDGDTVKNPDESDPNSGIEYDYNKFLYLAFNLNHNPEFEQTGIMDINGLLSYISYHNNIKTFYLTFPDNDVDTITYDAQEVSCEQGWKEKCQCTLPVRMLKYNGKAVDIDTNYHLSNGQPVYVFDK